MKKILKAFSAAVIFAAVSSVAVAQTNAFNSGLREATARTVEDDVYNLMNVITWDQLKFKKHFGFVNLLGTNDDLNLAFATYT